MPSSFLIDDGRIFGYSVRSGDLEKPPTASSVCPVNPGKGCLECHMPRVRNEQLHIPLTDHYIRVRTLNRFLTSVSRLNSPLLAIEVTTVSSDLHDSTHDPLPSNPPQPAVAATPADGSKGLPMAGNVLRLRLLLFLAGLLAGACAAGLGEQLHNYFSPELKLVELQGNKMMQPVPESAHRGEPQERCPGQRRAGAFVCLCLGECRRSGAARAAVSAGLLGLALGTTIGAVASWVLYPLFYAAKHYTASTEPDLLVSLGIHSGMWALLGAAGGLAFAIGLGDRGRIGPAVIGGILGACVATLINEVTGAVFFPRREPASPSPRPGGPACWSGFSCRCSLLWQSASSSSCRSSQRSEPPFAHGPGMFQRVEGADMGVEVRPRHHRTYLLVVALIAVLTLILLSARVVLSRRSRSIHPLSEAAAAYRRGEDRVASRLARPAQGQEQRCRRLTAAGVLSFRLGDETRAESIYKSLGDDGLEGEDFYLLGLGQQRRGDLTGAVDSWQLGVQKDPGHVAMLAYLARSLGEAGSVHPWGSRDQAAREPARK